jgi:hypothetical protein
MVSIKNYFMKVMITGFLFLACSLVATAQSEQVKVYLKQIAANAKYITQLVKAINIARNGLTTIGRIRNGEMRLHEVFFKGLGNVNPAIKGWIRVTDIVSLQAQIVKTYTHHFKHIRTSGQFTEQEIRYIYSVFSRLLGDCGAILSTLSATLTPNAYRMSDDERIRRIALLYTQMQNNYRFMQRFSYNNLVLGMQRQHQQQEVNHSKLLFGLH